MRHNVVKEQYKKRTQTKISPVFKHGFNNTKYADNEKCFKTDVKIYIFTFMTSKFIL
jgi:hypothetical protein